MGSYSLFSYYYQPSPIELCIWGVICIISIIALWKIFEKAGKPGWAAIIPVYNLVVLLQITGRPIWWILLLFVPCFGGIFLLIGIVWVNNELSKSFGKSVGFTVGLVLLNPIFLCILAFGDAAYLGPGGPPVIYGADDYEKPFDINPGA